MGWRPYWAYSGPRGRLFIDPGFTGLDFIPDQPQQGSKEDRWQSSRQAGGKRWHGVGGAGYMFRLLGRSRYTGEAQNLTPPVSTGGNGQAGKPGLSWSPDPELGLSLVTGPGKPWLPCLRMGRTSIHVHLWTRHRFSLPWWWLFTQWCWPFAFLSLCIAPEHSVLIKHHA